MRVTQQMLESAGWVKARAPVTREVYWKHAAHSWRKYSFYEAVAIYREQNGGGAACE